MITARDGTPASSLTFGTMQFGGTATVQDSAAMWEACRAAGLNHFDTAWVYTGGASEEITGQLAAAERARLIIATKAAYQGGAGAANIRAQLDQSRQRLQMDAVDILYLHRFDPDTPLEETFEALATLQAEGALRYIGVSNFAAWQVVKAQGVAAQFDTKIDILQPMYSLVKRQAEVEIFPMAADLGLSVAPYSPLGGGLLTGKYGAGGTGNPQGTGKTGRLSEDARYAARYGLDWMHAAADGLVKIAAREGLPAATLAVAWAASHATGPSPIISARNATQLAPSLAAADYPMAPELRAELTALTPPLAPATDRLEEA